MFKTWHSPLNHGINCGRRNEQVVSQPFLFWFGLSSSSLDKFPFFLLSFPFFPLFICLCIYLFIFVFLLLFYLFPFHHLFFFFFKFLFRPFLLLFYFLFILFLLFLLEWEKITQKELFSMVTTSVVSNP